MAKRKSKIGKHQKQSIIKQTLEQKKSVQNLETDECLVISFKHLDKNQFPPSTDFQEWEEKNMLARAMYTLAGCTTSTIGELEANSNKFTVYDGFPPEDKTDYTHPIHVPEDARWTRLHITGLQCVIGHLVKNTFYIVFLDTEHRFWKSQQ